MKKFSEQIWVDKWKNRFKSKIRYFLQGKYMFDFLGHPSYPCCHWSTFPDNVDWHPDVTWSFETSWYWTPALQKCLWIWNWLSMVACCNVYYILNWNFVWHIVDVWANFKRNWQTCGICYFHPHLPVQVIIIIIFLFSYYISDYLNLPTIGSR